MHVWQAAVLGLVEGLTEFLPVSSTGHLILAGQLLRLQGEAVKTFEIVIQAGALAAVAGLYRKHLAAMASGVVGRDERGRRLLCALLISFAPAVVAGLFLRKVIKARLFSTWPVIGALAAGGALMIVSDRWISRRQKPQKGLYSVTMTEALLIGCAQCLALWPGTSRSMVTILAGLSLGLPPAGAAEYSFLLALPTLGAATVLDFASSGRQLLEQVGGVSLLCGYLVAAFVAVLAMRGLVRYLNRHGLAVFGWYRIALAGLVWIVANRG